MQSFLFFNASSESGGIYDREYDAEDFSEFFRDMISNGIVENEENKNSFMPYVSGGNLYVSAGKAYINGKKYINTESIPFVVGSVTKSKILAIKLSLNYDTRDFTIFTSEYDTLDKIVLKRDNINHELMLGYVRLYPNVSLSSVNVIDTRRNTKYCGVAKARI